MNQNCAVAAQDFVCCLSKVFGENIARAIIENSDASKLDEYDQIKQQLGGMSGPGMQEFVYPNQLSGPGVFPTPQAMTAFPGGPQTFPPGWRPPSFQEQH